MRFRPLFFLLVVALAAVTSGCAKLTHLQELLTLKGYSDESLAHEKHIKSQDAKFEKLIAAVKDGSISDFRQPRSFRVAFGDPVYVREISKDGIICQEWLYRYTVRYLDSDKVYLYFSQDGKFLKWEYVPQAKENKNG